MNLKNLKNLKKGFQELTPTQISQGKIAGYIGMIIGILLADIRMFMGGSWGLGIFMAFLCWFQLMGLAAEIQGYKNLQLMEEQMKNNQVLDDFDELLNKKKEHLKEGN